MVLMPVLCPSCHSDRVITGGTTTAGEHHAPCHNAARPHSALLRDCLDAGRLSALQAQSVARRPNGSGLFFIRSVCRLPVDNRTGHRCNTTVHRMVGRRTNHASTYRPGIHHGTPRAPAGALSQILLRRS
jgi:hypothetical protein